MVLSRGLLTRDKGAVCSVFRFTEIPTCSSLGHSHQLSPNSRRRWAPHQHAERCKPISRRLQCINHDIVKLEPRSPPSVSSRPYCRVLHRVIDTGIFRNFCHLVCTTGCNWTSFVAYVSRNQELLFLALSPAFSSLKELISCCNTLIYSMAFSTVAAFELPL